MPNKNPNHREGNTAKMLEEQTAKLPSDVYLWAAVGSMAVSLALFCTKNKHASIFIGQWAPSILIMGLYNKLVKTLGHNSEDNISSNQPSFKSTAEAL